MLIKGLETIRKITPYFILFFLSVCCLMLLSEYREAFPIRSNTQSAWNNTATIINGLISPILALVSIVLLWMTWVTTKSEMKLTRRLLDIQLIEEKKKNSLEIFSRRINNLNDKINKKIDIRTSSNVANDLINLLHGAASCDDRVNLSKLLTNHVSENFNSGSSEVTAAELTSLIFNRGFYVSTALHRYVVSINKELKPDFSSCIKMKDKEECLNILLGYHFYSSNEFNVINNALSRLINNICEYDEITKNELFEEFALNFDMELAKAIIGMPSSEINEEAKVAIRKM
jgi:hypothetical protein